MRLHYLIIFLLLWLATPLAAAQARLTLGAAPEDTPGLPTPEQAQQLAGALGNAMGEEVELRVFNSRVELDRWLVKFSMVDLAIYDAAFLADRPGQYLVIGGADTTGKLFIVSRQGVAGDLPQRVARALQQPLATSAEKTALKPAKPQKAPQPRPAEAPPATTVVRTDTAAPPLTTAKPVSQLPAPKVEVQTTPASSTLPPVKQESAEATTQDPPGGMKSLRGDSPPVTPPPPLIFPELPAALEAPSLPPEPVVVAPVIAVEAESPAEPVKAAKRIKPLTPAGPTPAVVHEPAEKAPEATAAAEPALPTVAPQAEAPVPVAVTAPTMPEVTASAPTTAVAVEAEKLAEPVKVAKRVKPLTPAEPAPAVVPEPVVTVPAATATAAAEPALPTVAPQAEAPVPVAVTAPTMPEVTASAPTTAVAVEAEKPAEPVRVAKRIKPLTPAEPAPAVVPEPVATAAAEPALPTAEPQAEPPVPTAVETPVQTVSVVRPEPAGVTPPPAAQPPAPQPPVIAHEVPAVIAQPDIPQELRPPGVPVSRPSRLPAAPLPKEDVKSLLTAKLPEKIGRTQKPAPLLPPPDPEPGIVYVVPFITLMVPDAVRERIFDQFVDKLNASGANRKLRFVILKEPLEKIDREWLDARKYVFGEIFGYVEESGCCSTDLRAKARLTYYRSHHPQPSLRYEFPVRTFFDHNKTSIEVERQRLADQIANALVSELTKALQP